AICAHIYQHAAWAIGADGQASHCRSRSPKLCRGHVFCAYSNLSQWRVLGDRCPVLSGESGASLGRPGVPTWAIFSRNGGREGRPYSWTGETPVAPPSTTSQLNQH